MNNSRRKAIRNIIKLLRESCPNFDYIEAELNDILEEETEAMENIPESLQDTDRYMIAEDSVNCLDEALGALDADDPNCIEEVIDALQQIDGI